MLYLVPWTGYKYKFPSSLPPVCLSESSDEVHGSECRRHSTILPTYLLVAIHFIGISYTAGQREGRKEKEERRNENYGLNQEAVEQKRQAEEKGGEGAEMRDETKIFTPIASQGKSC